jgi:hypothetical protein
MAFPWYAMMPQRLGSRDHRQEPLAAFVIAFLDDPGIQTGIGAVLPRQVPACPTDLA